MIRPAPCAQNLRNRLSPRRLVSLLMLILGLTLSPVWPALAQDQPPPPISDTLSDFAGLLGPDQAQVLTQNLRAARAETGVQIVVATIDRLPAGQRVEDYAKALFNAWGVGDAARNDGILLLVVREARLVRVALGAGYDPVWDGAAQRAVDTAMLPEFRRDRFAEGLSGGVAALIDRVARPFAAGQTAPPAPARSRPLADLLVPGAMVAVFLAVVLGGTLRKRQRARAQMPANRSCPQCGQRGLILDPPAGGAVMRVLRCPACGWTSPDGDNRRHRDPAARAAAADRDRGGFGGGRSSGGGATGRF